MSDRGRPREPGGCANSSFHFHTDSRCSSCIEGFGASLLPNVGESTQNSTSCISPSVHTAALAYARSSATDSGCGTDGWTETEWTRCVCCPMVRRYDVLRANGTSCAQPVWSSVWLGDGLVTDCLQCLFPRLSRSTDWGAPRIEENSIVQPTDLATVPYQQQTVLRQSLPRFVRIYSLYRVVSLFSFFPTTTVVIAAFDRQSYNYSSW